MADTRQRSVVENTSADARTFGEQAMLDPSPEAMERARASTERWLSAGIEVNDQVRPWGPRNKREEMVEALRAMRSGANTLAGLYLRHGDAKGAAEALERSEGRRVASAGLLARLSSAATANDPEAWRDLVMLYSHAPSDEEDEELAMHEGIAEGAAWGSAVAAYRADPTQMFTAGPLALLLARYGMAEGAPLVLASAVRANPTPANLNPALRIVADVMLHEDDARDYRSVQRVFAASKELLSLADAAAAKHTLDPTPARLRGMMGSLHVRYGNVALARPMFEQFVQEEPTAAGFHALAQLLLQAGEPDRAIATVEQGLKAHQVTTNLTMRARLNILAFQAYRDQENQQQASNKLGAALNDALEARNTAQTDIAHATADGILARLAHHYGDQKAWRRAVDRMLERAAADQRVASMAIIEATATGLLFNDIRTVHRVFDELVDGVEPEDSVYAALWVLLTEQASGASTSGSARQALAAVGPDNGWVYHLARHGLGEIDDAALRTRAKSVVERAEADFYIAMRLRARGDASAADRLRQIATGVAIDLVETHMARELLQSKSWGPAPRPMP